jgi:hypothetical protein
MYATMRRGERIDNVRSEDVTRTVGESLVPALRKVPGFSGCYVFDGREGVFTSMRTSRAAQPFRTASRRLPRAPRTSSRRTSKSRSSIGRTVQGGLS